MRDRGRRKHRSGSGGSGGAGLAVEEAEVRGGVGVGLGPAVGDAGLDEVVWRDHQCHQVIGGDSEGAEPAPSPSKLNP